MSEALAGSREATSESRSDVDWRVDSPVIRARALVRRFGRLKAVDGIDLEIPRGCVVGLIGDNGAGKSTFLRMTLGLLRPSSGTLEVLGANPRRSGAAVRARIGYVPEDRRLARGARVQRMLRYAASFYDTWDAALEKELVDRFDLDPRQKIGTLSRGGLAKLYLLMALAPRPELLVLDEATGGIDAVARREIFGTLVQLAGTGDVTVVFASHVLQDVERVVDRVVMMHRGKIVLDCELDDLKSRYARLSVRFDNEAPEPPARGTDGILLAERRRREWVLLSSEAARTRRFLESASGPAPVAIEKLPMSLEDIFVELVTAKKVTS